MSRISCRHVEEWAREKRRLFIFSFVVLGSMQQKESEWSFCSYSWHPAGPFGSLSRTVFICVAFGLHDSIPMGVSPFICCPVGAQLGLPGVWNLVAFN